MIARLGPDKLARTRCAILLVALALTVIGILFVHSTKGGGAPFPGSWARGQILKALCALAAFLVVTRIDYRILDRWAYPIYGTLCAILAGMIVMKHLSGGINSFIRIHDFQGQPSEIMKVALILALAKYLRFREDQRKAQGLLAPVLLMLFPMGLVLLQPDLGTSLMLPPVLVAMLYVAGARPKHLVPAILLGDLVLPAAYKWGDRLPFVRPFQVDRLSVFFDQANASRRAAAYQFYQSLIALGSGGPFGKGLGQGTQNTLEHLPERHTDFIYSIIGEELGFVGAGGVAVLFLLLVVLILRVAFLTREPFGRLAVTGVAVAFAAQSFENMGMTMGLTPITGVPLPFVSHGGSSLLTSYLALAVAFNVAARRVPVMAPKDLDPSDAADRPVFVEDPAAGLLRNRWPLE